MRDRLIELVRNIPPMRIECEGRAQGRTYRTAEHIADHLLENGVIVPPCKVGDVVYRIVKPFLGEPIIVKGEVVEASETHEFDGKITRHFYFRAESDTYDRINYSLWCEFSDFGKIVFSSREEAERALKGADDEKAD